MLIVIKTSPGAAQLIARLLDSIGKSEGILGTIAGDDTIFYHTNAWHKNCRFTQKCSTFI